MKSADYYMNIALNEAKKSKKYGDIPIGAVIVCDDKIISKAYNKKHKNKNCLHHAEIIAINKACKKLNNFRLENCDMYVTKEPCLMCMGAILSARINKIFYGCKDKKYGTIDLAYNNNFNHKCEVVGEILNEECSEIITEFFRKLRENKEID